MLVEIGSQPSFKESLLIAVIGNEGFRNDELTRQLTPEKFRFDELQSRISRIADPQQRLNEIVRLAKLWTYHVEQQAWAWYGELSRPGFRVFISYNEEKAPVGVAIWSLPSPLRPQPSCLRRLWIAIRQLRSSLHIAWIQLWYPGLSPRSMPSTKRFFYDIENEMEFIHTKEREQRLLSMSEEDRFNTGYTVDLSYYLRFFAVCDPGKGHGKRLMAAIELNAQPFVLGNVRIEPKLTMIASPMGLPLYEKFGFRSISRIQRNVNGAAIARDLMVCP